jgi:hypothetical protein
MVVMESIKDNNLEFKNLMKKIEDRILAIEDRILVIRIFQTGECDLPVHGRQNLLTCSLVID